MGVVSPWSKLCLWTLVACNEDPLSYELWHSLSPRRLTCDHTPRPHHVITSLQSSTRMKNKSKRDMIGAPMFRFCCREPRPPHQMRATPTTPPPTFKDLLLSYLPPTGLAAAKMEVRALSVALTPALVMEMVCCSMASWIAT